MASICFLIHTNICVYISEGFTCRRALVRPRIRFPFFFWLDPKAIASKISLLWHLSKHIYIYYEYVSFAYINIIIYLVIYFCFFFSLPISRVYVCVCLRLFGCDDACYYTYVVCKWCVVIYDHYCPSRNHGKINNNDVDNDNNNEIGNWKRTDGRVLECLEGHASSMTLFNTLTYNVEWATSCWKI